ncbi:MAG TPA: cobalamin biosynthesis protein [archaeon]|nr:cobalamin biosynthesis protein [archaeon]
MVLRWDAAALALCLAVVLDIALGEPPPPIHPTVWMGRLIEIGYRFGRSLRPSMQKAWGVVLVVGVVAVFALAAYVLLQVVYGLFTEPLQILITAVLLKCTFSIRRMREYALDLASAVRRNDYAEARSILRHIVRRDPATLTDTQVISAGVETVAEGMGDGIASPLFYYALFGVPGAFAYRAINTLDSMVGYKDPEFLNLGWFSAKLDSLANWLPARLASILMLLAGRLLGESASRGWRILLRDRNRTESWNAGWLMSAMAGLLGVRLEKPGFYTLGDPDQQLNYSHLTRAVRIMTADTILFILALIPIILTVGWAINVVR